MRRWLTSLTVLAIGLALTAPAFAQSVLFGPKQYTRTAGPPNQFTDTFTLPAGTTAPYTLHVVNGNANGTNRISSATVKLNGTKILDPSDFGQNVAVLDRTVTLQASNTLEIRLTSAPGSFLTVSVLDTSAGTQPTALTPNPLGLTVGATANLTATLAPAPTASGSVTVTSSNTAVATVPASVPFIAGQASLPIPVTAIASGSTTVTVSLNGASVASQVDVALPVPTVTGFSPTSGQPGTSVTITGANFVNVQTVRFNGVLAPTFTVTNATTLTALVPPTATTGPIAAMTLAGTGTSAGSFTVIPAPTIASLQPATLSIVRGETGTLTVTLSTVQTTATSVTLASSNTTVATVPGSVSVLANQLSAHVTVTAIAPGQADITASLNGTSASSTITVVNPVPSITTLSPASLPSGSPNQTLTVTGQQFVNGAIVQFGTTALVTTIVSTTQLTATIPAALLTAKGTIPVTVENPMPGGGTSNSLSFTIVNGAPVLAPIGNQTVPLGSTLTFTTTATDPDNDPVHFAVTPAPLPAHAAFDVQTGIFTFAPDATQVGVFTFTFSATDGAASASETLTVTVTGAQPGGVTALFGRVDDTSQHPLANLPLTLRGTTLTTTTNAQGEFTLSSATMPTERQTLLVNGFVQGFAVLAAPVDIIAGVTNQVPQPFTLPPVDLSTQVTVNPAATTVLTSPALNVTVTIPPNTAKNANGSAYTGVLTISPVPEYGRTESRPAELRPGLSITIQPAGVVMDPPVPITFPNLDNMPANSLLDLWSLSPDTGTFNAVGKMRVSADGLRVETLSGGVRKTAWHFVLAAPAFPQSASAGNTDECTECTQIASGSDLTQGALTHEVTIPGVRTLGVVRNLTLHYRSTSADVRPILPLNVTLGGGVAVPQTFSIRLSVGGIQQGSDLYWSAASLSQTAVSRLGMQFDGATLGTGRYGVDTTAFSNYPQSSIGGTAPNRILVRNERASPFGAGWTMSGLDRLLVQSDGSLVLAKGEGGTVAYSRKNRPLVIASLDESRSVVSGGVNYSFVTGAAHSQPRQDLLNLANFGPLGVVPRPVMLRPGLAQVTLQALEGVDLFIINLLQTDLTLTEVIALEQFVREGGALMAMRNAAPFQEPYLNVFGGAFTFDTSIPLTTDGSSSPLAQGPFGTVASPINMGANGAFALTGVMTVLANNSAGPNLMLLQQGANYGGAGRAVLSGDEDIFTSTCVLSCSALYPAFPNNQKLWLNTIAFLSGAPGYRTPPPPPGATIQYVGPSGDFSAFVMNVDGTFTRALKDGTKYQFNAQGLQTAVTDRNNNTTAYAYDAQNRLTTLTDPAGQVTTFLYSGSVLSSIVDPANRVTQFSHDSGGNLTGVTSADTAQEIFSYDPQHRLTQRTDARNQTYQYQYDFTGRFSQATLPNGEIRKISPSQKVAVPNITTGQGTAGSPATVGGAISVAAYTDANNRTTAFETDSFGRITKQIDALNRTTTITRDPQGNPLTITRPNSAITTMTYDAKGNLLTSTEQSIAATTTFTYEPTFNQVTRITDPKGNQTNITYDVKGNPLTITDADNKVTTFTYDSRGLLLTSKDALNQTTTFTYNTLGRLLTTTDPLNRTTTLTYDNAGNVATSTDALNRVTTFEYDPKNRLKQVTDPLTGVTQYTYDGNGNLLTVKDAKNQTTTFAYDSRNRLQSTTDPLGKVEAYEYDGNDNLTKRITPKLDQITFAYDPVNQLLSKTLPGAQVTSYTYSTVGNLLTVTDTDSALTMTYDQANRLLTTSTAGSTNQPNVSLTYTYDKNGNRLTAVDPSGTNTYTYDSLNRLANLASSAGLASFAYDALSRRTSLTLPNGTQTTYSYDPASQVTNILHQLTATSTQINKADCLYNPVGNRTSLTDRRGAQAFGYDNLDRLTSASHPLLATPQAFAYDAVGNRTTGGSVVNAGNQLTADSNFAYQYDDNGNLTRMTLLATGNFTVYTYDAENRLTKAEDFVAGNPTPAATSTYRYDGLGRRIEKVANGQTTRYIYDGEDILLEYDGANVLQARYTHGPGIDEPIAVTKGASTFFYHQDGLGTVTDLTDSTGATAKSYSYDAYGTIVDQTGTVEQPYTYTGRELDSESGLYYYRARYYDPTNGRFLQKDPASGDAGFTMYHYADGLPTGLRDPEGLATVMAGGGSNKWELLKKLVEFCVDKTLKIFKKAKPTKAKPDLSKVTPKKQRQMQQRGWNDKQVQEAVDKGEQIPAINKETGNSATRYVHPETGKSVVIDDVTGQPIQFGGKGFKHGPGSGDLID